VTACMQCRIRIKGHLSGRWDGWFAGLKIESQPCGETMLYGPLPDQAALYGVLNQMRDLGLELVSLDCARPGKGRAQDKERVPARGNDVGDPSQA
jgi:hypothetical protein